MIMFMIIEVVHLLPLKINKKLHFDPNLLNLVWPLINVFEIITLSFMQ